MLANRKTKNINLINSGLFMQLTLNEMRDLNRVLDVNIKKFNENIDVLLTLKEVNKSILRLSQKRIFENVTINHIIQLGTLLRRGNQACRKISYSFMLSLIQTSSKADLNNIAYYQIQLRYLLFETLKKLSSNEEYLKLGSNLVWMDEKEKVKQFLLNCQPVNKNEIKDFVKKFSPELSRFIASGALTHFIKNIKKIIYIAEDTQSQFNLEARKVLSYLVDENDVISDTYGIFGLADDLQVYEDFITKISDDDNTKKQLGELLLFDDSTLSLFFERTHKISEFRDLAASSPHINYIISSLKYLIENNKKRILAILPDNNLIGLILILNLLTLNKKQSIKNEKKNLKYGDTIYFNLRSRSIEVKYLGEHKEAPELIVVSDVENNQKNSNTSLTLPKFAIELSTNKPKSKKVISDASLIQEWQNTKIDFVPQHITFSNLNKKIFYLTRKNKFENYQNFLKPFGQKLSNFINFQYKSINRNDEESFENNLPEVNVFSSAEFLIDTLDDVVQSQKTEYQNFIVICDEPILARQFMEMFSDGFGNENVELIFLSSIEENNLNDVLLNRNFLPIHYPSQISSFNPVEHKINYDDELSKLEEKFFKSTKQINKVNHPISSKIFDDFTKNLIEMFKNHRQSDKNVTEKLIFKLFQIKDDIFTNWLPFTELEKHSCRKILSETKELLKLEYNDNENLFNIFNILNDHEEDILNIFVQRGVFRYLNFNSEFKYTILDAKKSSSIFLNKKLIDLNILNAKVISFAELKGQYIDEKLIIPFQLAQKINKYLCQNNTADNIEFFLFKNEFQDFEYQSRKSLSEVNKFKKLTKNTFNQTSISSLIKEVKEEPKEKISSVQISEYENNFLEDMVPDTKNVNFTEIVEAIPFFLDNKSKLILITPNSTLFIVEESGNSNNKKLFKTKNASQIDEGDKICLPLDSKADMFEELAKSFSPEYSNTKNKATTWKKELKILYRNSFESNINQFTEYLKNKGIKREVGTVKNWLSDEIMIAPLKYEEILQKMKNLPVRERFKREIKENITFIDKCYKMRRETSDKILDIMNRSGNISITDKIIKIMFRNASLQLAVHEISTMTQLKKVSVDQLWQVNDL